MTKEEKMEWLRALTQGNRVEVVLEKHVQYEIGKVEAGGIGIQVVYSGRAEKSAEGQHSERKPKTADPKIISSVFSYRWGETMAYRIAMLYQYLLRVGLLDKDTDMEQFCALFSGEDCDYKVKWTGKQSQLFYLIKVLLQQDYIRTPDGVGQWEIVQSHFLNAGSRVFTNFHKQKKPKKTAATLEQIAEILNPARNIDARTFAEALQSLSPMDEEDE